MLKVISLVVTIGNAKEALAETLASNLKEPLKGALVEYWNDKILDLEHEARRLED